MNRKALLLGASALILIWSAAVSAQMYKWTDSDGNVHYTQDPPPSGVQGTTIAPPPPPASQASTDASGNGDGQGKDKGDGKAPPPTADIAREKKEAEAKKNNCEAARKNLQIYTQYRRIMVNGQSTVLSNEARAKGIAEAKKNIADNCK